jgi:small-conductance mechanosensitive channel
VVERHVYRMAAERARAASIAALILGAILIAIVLLTFALIIVVATGSRGSDSGPFLVALGLLALTSIALLVAAVLVRREARRVQITVTPEGIEYEARGILMRSSWDNSVRIGIVPICLGYGEGIVLRESGLIRARLAGILRANHLDRVIPLSYVMWWWRETELADDLARWATHLGISERTPSP